MDKTEFIKSLKGVKVVLGNGFDLCCGLHTKYSDFYCKNWKKYIHITELSKHFINSNKEINEQDELIKTINVWDVFFALNSSENPKENIYDWCDIELLMKDSFYDSKKEDDTASFYEYVFNSNSSINWHMVRRIVESPNPIERTEQGFVAAFIILKMKECKWGLGRFYDFLLAQLKVFEKEFGEFIYWQLHFGRIEETRFGVINPNRLYIKKAMYVLNQLCDIATATIDTFNFSFIEDDEVYSKITHINSTFQEPIFGVDTYMQPIKPEYIFTKSSRRMDLDMRDAEYYQKNEFNHVVIFGHSLNEADYSYYFPVFDKLKLLDTNAGGLLVFAYYVWDKKDEENIKSSLRTKISRMMYKYAEENNVKNPNRFLDVLSTQGRIITYEIVDFPDSIKRYTNELDYEWNRIYKEVLTYMEDNQ